VIPPLPARGRPGRDHGRPVAPQRPEPQRPGPPIPPNPLGNGHRSDVPPVLPGRRAPDRAASTADRPVPPFAGFASSGFASSGSAGAGASVEPGAEPPGRHRRRVGEPPDTGGSGPDRDAAASSGSRAARRRRSSFWKELPLLVVVALVLTFLIQTFLAKVYVIPSGSMEATLHGCVGCNNDRVLVDKITYRLSEPAPGDVVVFRGPDSWSSEVIVEQPSNVLVRGLQLLGSLVGLAPPDEKDFVKRVIAVGGQTVQCCDTDNRVTVDGQPLDEPYLYYLPEAGPARQNAFGPVTVPDGQLWVMGDSRNNSADSRVADHGPIPVDNVIGKARMIVLPFPRFGWIE
jgi:signal peptidase I